MKGKNNMNRKVSIIIPIFNGEKYIYRCLESIKNQTYKNLEIICIDDGSTDNTQEILENNKKNDNRIINIIKENEGVSIARNIGIKKATGDYITFIDVDDWIEEDWIEKLVICIENNDCDVVKGNYIKNNANGKIIKYGNLQNLDNIKLSNEKIEILKEYIVIGKLPAYTWTLLIKSEVIKNKVFFEKNIPFMEDTIFYIDLLNKINSIYICDLKSYHYCYNDKSATKNLNFYKRNIENIKKVNSILKRKINKRLYSKMTARHLKSIVEYLFKLYKGNMINKKEIINMLQDNSIKEMINCINKDDIEKIGVIKMIKKNKYSYIYIYFKIRIIISKFRDKFIGER